MTDTNGPSGIGQSLIQRSFLSLYLLPQQEQSNKDGSDNDGFSDYYFSGYDCVFEFAQATLYLLIDENVLKTSRSQVSASQIRELRKKTANQQIKRHNLLYRKSLKANASLAETLNNLEKPVYFIGLIDLAVEQLPPRSYSMMRRPRQPSQFHQINHQYGSQFFFEECVLDLDDEYRVLQVFSLQSFANIVEQLETPSDLQVFLQYHRSKLVAQQFFQDETTLLEEFLGSPAFYQRAINVQKQLVDIGLLDTVEPRLLKAVASAQSAFAQTLNAKLRSYSRMWYKLINGLSKRLATSGAALPIDHVKMLIGESMYTRNCIIEEVMAYAESSVESRLQGYVRHQHSYDAFGRHYILVFYAQDKASTLSAESIQANHSDLLFEVNTQLQDPVMDDLFLIGIDFVYDETSGSFEVLIDVYHQKGSVLNADVQRLYEQLATLKAQNSE